MATRARRSSAVWVGRAGFNRRPSLHVVFVSPGHRSQRRVAAKARWQACRPCFLIQKTLLLPCEHSFLWVAVFSALHLQSDAPEQACVFVWTRDEHCGFTREFLLGFRGFHVLMLFNRRGVSERAWCGETPTQRSRRVNPERCSYRKPRHRGTKSVRLRQRPWCTSAPQTRQLR